MNLGLAIAIVGTGVIVDKLITKNIFSRNFTRKFFVACCKSREKPFGGRQEIEK